MIVRYIDFSYQKQVSTQSKLKVRKMNIESIGTWAGEVYKALESSENGVLGLKGIKKVTKLKKDELMAAFGWLGREGKIVLTTNDEDLVVSLVR